MYNKNDLTIPELITGFAKQGQKFYINIFYNSLCNISSNMMKKCLAKHLQTQMAVQQKSKEVNMKNTNKDGILRLLKQHGPHIHMATTEQQRHRWSRKKHYER